MFNNIGCRLGLLAVAIPLSIGKGAPQGRAGQATLSMGSSEPAGAGSGQLFSLVDVQSRSLADGGCSSQDAGFVFVDSAITNLGNPIGGCYENSTISVGSDDFPSYALWGGGPVSGQAWIYVTRVGSWELGMVEDVDEVTGEVLSIETICTNNYRASDLSGPADTQLNGVWDCAYFQEGITNYAAADFMAVECGCSGRSISGGGSSSSSSDGVFSTATAIACLTVIAVLLVLVCSCVFLIQRKKKAHGEAAPVAPEETA